MNRIEVLEELKRYYSAELAEDKQDGTNFDCAVLDALDNLIAAQRGELSVPKQQWISVSDRLPEKERVLARSTGGVDVLYYYEGEWWRPMDGIWAFTVTHWMPLPPSP